MQIEVMVGRSGKLSIVLLKMGEVTYPLSNEEAQRLGTSILISCGVSMERWKDGGQGPIIEISI